jgi:hypothetical protein
MDDGHKYIWDEMIKTAKKLQPLCENWNEKGIGEKGIAATG